MKCAYCGAELPEGCGFCPTCGKPVDDDEVVDVGFVGSKPEPKPAGGSHSKPATANRAKAASSKRRKSVPDTSIDGAFDDDKKTHKSEDAYEEEDYSLDDIPPMPLAQKITLLLVIALVVIAASYIIWYQVVH